MKSFYLISSVRETIIVYDKPECFDLTSGCSKCGTNSRRLKLVINRFPKSDFDSTVQHDYLLSSKAGSDLKSQGINVSHLKEAILNKDKSGSGFYHLTGEHELPRMMSNSKGIITESQCELCGQDGFYDTTKENPEYYYPKNTLFNSADILSTWEHFGPSIKNPSGNRIFRLARPRIIVSEKVKCILEKIKYSKLKFEQIKIEE